MIWKNPKTELPQEGQLVWVMLEPEKAYSKFEDLVQGVQIFAGICEHARDNSSCRVTNGDYLGQGNISWYLKLPEKALGYYPKVIGWLPIEDMALPVIGD